MKRVIAGVFIYVISALLWGCGEEVNSNSNRELQVALKRFPGVDKGQMERLLWAREQMCLDRNIDDPTVRAIENNTGGSCRIPLPTWLPAGFAMEQLFIKVGEGVRQDSLKLMMVYSKKQTDGKKQVFAIEAGFEFGGLPYTGHYTVRSSIGDIWLYYEPMNDTIYGEADSWGKPIKDLSETEWFGAEKLHYPLYAYVSTASRLADEGIVDSVNFEMISLEDTKGILASMEEL